MKNKTDIYSALVNEVEKIKADGLTPSRFEMLKILCDEWGHEINYDAVDLVEKLYHDGFVGP